MDYVLNGRKNRGGHQWSSLLKNFCTRRASLIETNFYTGGGSKLNETARSYKLIAEESRDIGGFKFVWITDGNGWKSARRNLKETFLVLDMLYNIRDLEDGIFLELFND